MRKAVAISGISLILIGGVVGFLSYQELQQSRQVETVQKQLDEQFGHKLLSSNVDTGSEILEVTAVIVEPGINSTRLEASLEEITGTDVELEFYSVS
jgi:hypothetical protein